MSTVPASHGRWQRADAYLAGALLALSSLAFVNLLAIPAFVDEGIHMRFIWRAIDANEWLQSLSLGRPLEVWPMVPFVQLGLPPLVVIRTLHVLAGMLGAVLVYRLALQPGNRSTAFTCGVLYAICPFVVYLQRLAIPDMFLCTAGLWVLLCALRFCDFPSWKHAAAFSTALVVAAFCKFPVGFVFLSALPLAFLFMPATERRHLILNWKKSVGVYAAPLLLLTVVVVVVLWQFDHGRRLGFGVKDLIGIGGGGYATVGAASGASHLSLLSELAAQLSWPVLLVAFMGLLASAIYGDWHLRWLIAMGLLPMLAIGLAAHSWFSRYLLFTLPPLMIASVSGWKYLSGQLGKYAPYARVPVLAVCAGFMAHQSALLILDPLAASWSPLDRFQYLEAWGSGYGYPEAARFVLSSQEQPAMICSLDTPGAYQLRAYLPAEWGSKVHAVIYAENGQVLRSPQARVANLLSRTPTWVVMSDQIVQSYFDSSLGAIGRDQIQLEEIASFPKPGSRARLSLYKVTAR